MGQCGSSNKPATPAAPVVEEEVSDEVDMKKLYQKIDKLAKHVDGHPCVVQAN